MIISTDENVFLRVLEILCPFSIFFEFLEIFFDIFCILWLSIALMECIRETRLCYLIEFLLVDPHFTIDRKLSLVNQGSLTILELSLFLSSCQYKSRGSSFYSKLINYLNCTF